MFVIYKDKKQFNFKYLTLLLIPSVIIIFVILKNIGENKLATRCTQPNWEIREIKYFSFYFPQFHEFRENNKFWGKGFTEFVNLKRVDVNRWGYEVPKPLKFYDLTDPSNRITQYDEAISIGLHGFIIHAYWFGYPVMDKVVRHMINDKTNLKMIINWANEPWTKRWDGGNNDLLLNQVYPIDDELRKSFNKYFCELLNGQNIYTYNGTKFLFVYRLNDVPNIPQIISDLEMCTQFKIELVQLLNGKFSNYDNSMNNHISIYGDFEPNYRGLTQKTILTPRRCYENYMPGVVVDWDNSPRHIHDRYSFGWHVNNPRKFADRLKNEMDYMIRCPNSLIDNIILINAWNEYGERSVLERTVNLGEFGIAMQKHVETHNKMGVPLFLIRAYHGSVSGIYNIGRLCDSLINLENKRWRAIIIDMDFPRINKTILLNLCHDDRIEYSDLIKKSYDKYNLGGYDTVDSYIEMISGYDWIIITNSDNFYHKETLNYLDKKYDLIGLPFKSRWNHINKKWHNEIFVDDIDSCSQPTNSIINTFKLGETDLGANIIKLSFIKNNNLRFSEFDCPLCQDARLVEKMMQMGAKSLSLDKDVLFIHEPIPETCDELGGIWIDSQIISEIRCEEEENVQTLIDGDKYFIPGLKGFDSNFRRSFTNCLTTDQIYKQIVKSSVLDPNCFDEEYYFLLNPDVKASNINAYDHWFKYGVIERRDYDFKCGAKIVLWIKASFDKNELFFYNDELNLKTFCYLDKWDCFDYELLKLPKTLFLKGYLSPDYIIINNELTPVVDQVELKGKFGSNANTFYFHYRIFIRKYAFFGQQQNILKLFSEKM